MERPKKATKVKAESAIADMIKELRSNPRRYAALRTKVSAAKTDKERAALLVDFSMKEDTIRRRVPEGPEGPQEWVWTVATVTTILTGDTRKDDKKKLQ